jgi:hypothetical protein
MLYAALHCSCTLLVLLGSSQVDTMDGGGSGIDLLVSRTLVQARFRPRTTAFLVAFGPLVMGAMMSMLEGRRLFRPFGDVTIAPGYRLPSFLLHLGMGACVGVSPVYLLVLAALS